MIDLLASTVTGGMPDEALIAAKRAAFLAVLDEEDAAGRCQRGLIQQIRLEVAKRLG
jgi:hypothetical protein